VKTPEEKQPKSSTFSEINRGDLIVYYATKDCVVVGIFQVTSDIEYLPNDPYWKEIMIYKIKPSEMPSPGNYLDFRELVRDSTIQFDMFPNKRNWGNYLQGQTCKLMTENDFVIVKNALIKNEYLKPIREIKVKTTKWHRQYGKTRTTFRKTKAIGHQRAIEKWKIEEENKFGLFKPDIKTNNVDLNEILPKSVWLKENTKYVDGLAKLEIGGQPIYQSILEVQYRGSKEDLCVRVSIILPFVTRVDVVSDENSLKQIRELLERIADPNIVKSRVRFSSFKEFLS
jgi:hypothetical protein